MGGPRGNLFKEYLMKRITFAMLLALCIGLPISGCAMFGGGDENGCSTDENACNEGDDGDDSNPSDW